jgi:hypothetical protein
MKMIQTIFLVPHSFLVDIYVRGYEEGQKDPEKKYKPNLLEIRDLIRFNLDESQIQQFDLKVFVE